MNIKSRVDIDRDSRINNLEQTLFGKLSDIISAYEPKTEKQDNTNIQNISLEDALKELLQISKP